ncbi:MAG: phage tail protein [Deltaproteobacteria bacterium]|nr:phage tail protein [Deltaproteobacteria bacterium]
MTTISIRNNFPQVAAALDKLSRDIGDKAVVRALNTTIAQGKTEMARTISKEFRVSVGTAKERLKVYRASNRGGETRFIAQLEATKRGKGRSMNLIAFVTKGKVSKASAKRNGRTDLAGQLQFQIKRGGGKKAIKGAFIANSGRTVFVRTGKDRLPIKALNTIDVPQMFNTRRVNNVVKRMMIDKFPANFQRELRSVLKGYAK